MLYIYHIYKVIYIFIYIYKYIIEESRKIWKSVENIYNPRPPSPQAPKPPSRSGPQASRNISRMGIKHILFPPRSVNGGGGAPLPLRGAFRKATNAATLYVYRQLAPQWHHGNIFPRAPQNNKNSNCRGKNDKKQILVLRAF